MRSLPGIFKEHPDALVIIVGGESVSWWKTRRGMTWRQKFFNEVKDNIDVNRVLYTGYLLIIEI